MTEDQYTDDADVSQLEQRIDELEETIRQMLPSRREAIGMGVAGLAGASLMSGTASAGSSQVGTIGDASNLVDVQAEDIDVDDTITTQDLVVNGTATGPFGGGGVVLESGDSVTIETLFLETTEESFLTLYDGSAKDVLSGIIFGRRGNDWLYTFSDGTTIRRNGSGTTYSFDNDARGETTAGGFLEVTSLPPAIDVTKIEVATDHNQGSRMGASVILKD